MDKSVSIDTIRDTITTITTHKLLERSLISSLGGGLHLSLKEMKRMNGKRNANHETENDDSVSDDSKRLRRRQRQMGNDDAVNSYLTRINTTDLAPTAPGKVPGTTTSTHSIASIGENVYLPDYVREHNSTLTFPEKVRFCHCHCLGFARSR